MDRLELRRERSVETRDRGDSPLRGRWDAGFDDLEESGIDKSRDSGKHRRNERSKSSRREEKDPRSRDRDRPKASDALKDREKEGKDYEKLDRATSKDRRKEDRDDYDKERIRDKRKEKEYDREKYKDKEQEKDKDHKDRGRERDRDGERGGKDGERSREKERAKEKGREKDKEREKERDRAKDREREKEREKHKDRDREKVSGKDRDRDAAERERVKERIRDEEANEDRERPRERDKVGRKHQDEGHDRGKDAGKEDMLKLDRKDDQDMDITKRGKVYLHGDDGIRSINHQQLANGEPSGAQPPALELVQRISKMKEERLKTKSEGAPEILAWVNRSRKLQERRSSEKEKALQLKKVFEEQDYINQEDIEDQAAFQQTNLAGVKVLHGLDKVIEGGAVVLTLKDQSILADGDINQEMDVLENVEIGEQKQRDEAYKAAKKKTGIYDDKFNDEPGSERKILPQYDDPVVDEGVTLDASGRFSGDAEKKLEELRRRIQGVSTNNQFEDLSSSQKVASDYYTNEEMLRFKKPKKKKSLRKKEKLDLDAIEAEAVSAGLGIGDLGSRNDGKRQAIREEQERSEAEMRSNAYKIAYAKADEASKALRLEQTLTVKTEEADNSGFGDDDEDLRKSLERARKLALKKQHEAVASGPQAVALLASKTASNSTADDHNPASGESQENKVVFTEMEEFVWGLQLDEEAQKPDGEDVFMEEDEAPKVVDQEIKDEDGGWTEVKDTDKEGSPALEGKEEIVPDETIHEAAVGKGLSGALKLLKDRGTLKETVEWGGRNMDKKKSKLVGIYDDSGQKEIRIERTDEYGRILTPKEAFRLLSHKFHGKGPGKMKQEKRMRQYQEELKVKQMKNSDTPSLSVERMREAQAQLKTPYLVLSGHVKPGQTSDPRSGFATVEKDLPGGLTPMLGDRKVEHFLGIKRKADYGDMAPPKKPKT
ncbi:SART-1 family protein DOT2 isoform X2 [Diospyros lotus]|uniref:SART-1 family protein DOT2 isoform X2 n=1 Tax=Diospyros lotus TaxID=55363 RepID=UPI00225143E4|nr:SART-1 family protein DOT2 isoform X2 [Diospyros lotus]